MPVYSGHNGFQEWGPPPQSAGPVVVVSQGSSDGFSGCTLEARLANDAGADGEEVGAGVWLCDGPVGGWRAAWRRLSRYDA